MDLYDKMMCLVQLSDVDVDGVSDLHVIVDYGLSDVVGEQLTWPGQIVTGRAESGAKDLFTK